MRVLIAIVSTHEDYTTMMIDLLTDEGYQVVACRTSEEACELIHHTQPALVLLDLWLEHPHAGELVLARLHHDYRTQDTPVIICIEDQRDGAHIEALLREKRYAILFKPFNINVLLVILNEMIQPSATHHKTNDTASSLTQAAQAYQG